ncbi:MAG TPA: hypothetical protein VK613_10880 [Gaiellaceae bacterium]|nr:hypothetical protein [Gaiellaceae bacterium]
MTVGFYANPSTSGSLGTLVALKTAPFTTAGTNQDWSTVVQFRGTTLDDWSGLAVPADGLYDVRATLQYAACSGSTSCSPSSVGQPTLADYRDNYFGSDNTPPTISDSLDIAPVGSWFNIATGAPTVRFTCADSGGSGLTSCTPNFTFGEGAGLSKVGTAVDGAGNTATSTRSGVNVDLTRPTISASVSPSAASQPPAAAGNWWNIATGAPTVHFTCFDGGSGLAGSCPADVTFSADGAAQTASETVSDVAGNAASGPASATVNVDRTRPSSLVTSIAGSNAGVTAGGSASDAGSSGLNVGTPRPVHVDIRTGTCSGTPFAGSGLDLNVNPSGVWAYAAPSFPTAAGTYYVASVARDIAGNNQSSPSCLSYVIAAADSTPPDTSITANPSNPSGSSSATFSFTGSDDTTPPGSLTFECKLDAGSYALCTSPVTNPSLADGSHTFLVRASDAANNTDLSPASFTWVIDTVKPVITATATNADSSAYAAGTWTNQAVTVSFSCSDGSGSGIATDNTASDGGTLSTETSTGSFSAPGSDCVDKAGNAASPATVSNINIDLTPPVITGSRLPLANANGWNNSSVTVSFTCTDPNGLAPSGIDVNTVVGATLSGEGAGQSVTNTGSCVDKAGNAAASATVSNINIDLSAPGLSFSSPADGFSTIASTITASGTFSDNLSGVYNPNLTVNGVAATLGGSATSGNFSRSSVPLNCGNNTITASATDQAGNTQTAAIHVTKLCYTIQYYQPIDQSTGSNPIINTGKYGRVIPVKVNLYLNGVSQTDVNLAAYGLTLQIGVNSANCINGNVTTDVVETYADAGSSNGNTNLFRWSSPQWIYNLDTGNAPSVVMLTNSCYRLDAYVSDGSTKVLVSSIPYAIFKPTK